MRSVELSEHYLTIHIGNHAYEYAYFWLYDNQPHLRAKNGQKLSETIDIDFDIQPDVVALEEDSLKVQWHDQEEYSIYYVSWLLSMDEKISLPQTVWTVDELPKRSFEYHEITTNDSSLKTCLEEVIEYGFALIKKVPLKSEQVCAFAELFSYVRETNYGRYFDVKVLPDPNNLAYTAKGLPPHTDNPYRDPVPTLQLLHCLKADAEGGKSVLIDGFRLAMDLKKENPTAYDYLSKWPIEYKFEDDQVDLRNWTTVIGEKGDGSLYHIRFNNRSVQPFLFKGEQLKQYYKAYQTFEKMMHDPKYQYIFKLEAGDLILFDNERILHGRTEYTLNGERHLQGCYANRDGLVSKWRKTN
ncbi:MAG: TauD/TfdA family dioxygenase [Bacteroidota bacterium]